MSELQRQYYEKSKLTKCDFDFEKLDNKIKQSKSKIIAVDANNKNVMATKKNAKIAGVIKSITFCLCTISFHCPAIF